MVFLENGIDTNLIKDLWGVLKLDTDPMRLFKENIEYFIYAFAWKKIYFRDKNNDVLRRSLRY